MSLGLMAGVLSISLAAPTTHAATQIGQYPCYGTFTIYDIDGNPANPCDTANTNVVRDAWKAASITGWNGPSAPQPTGTGMDDLKARVTSLENQNATLQSQLQMLTQKVNQLASSQGQQPIVAAPVVQTVTQTVSGDLGTRLAAVEKRIKELDMITAMLDVNIGSLYARMDQLLDPIKKILKLK